VPRVRGGAASIRANTHVNYTVKPHSGIRKTVKWGGPVVCAVLTAMWIISIWWQIAWEPVSDHWISLWSGRLVVGESLPDGVGTTGWHLHRNDSPLGWWFDRARHGMIRYIAVPI